MTITPSALQYDAINAISNWYHNSSKQFFYLGGYAGSGKTSIAKMAVEKCGLDPDNSDHVLYGSFTGKATSVMIKKGMNASTIHQLIYKLIEKKNGELRFGLNLYSVVKDISLLVLDECSMINDITATDLLSFGTKILVLGDPAQLEPVQGTGYFTKNKPDFFLEEIHRQALDNPIIRLSMDVRNGNDIPYGVNGAVKKLDFNDISDTELLSADQVITGKHVTRHLLNTHMMGADGFDEGYPVMPGMKVICLRNYNKKGLINGYIGRTMNVVDQNEISANQRYINQQVMVEDGMYADFAPTDTMRMNMGAFQDNWDVRDDNTKANDDLIVENSITDGYDDPDAIQYLWDYAWAITCHKSQGSQWDNLIIFDDKMLSWKPEARKRWLYTAVTRAVETLTIVD
jgi:exodeoxyribonuclease-5